MRKEKDLDYYLNLPWRIKVEQIPDELGGGWKASIPLLGEWTCIGDGDTVREALVDLAHRFCRLVTEYLERGIEIPEPEPIEGYVRLSKWLREVKDGKERNYSNRNPEDATC